MKRLSGKTWALLALIAVAGFWSWRHWGPYSITNEHPTGTSIIAFGDSLTSGIGAPDDQSYPAQLSRLVGQPIFNAGVPGDTIADARRRLDRDVLSHNPRIVLICLGGNDLLRQTDLSMSFQTLREIIVRIQEKGALVILIGLGGNPLSPGLGGRYRSLARERGCPFVPDVLGGILGETRLMSDQIHPNSAGYARMAGKISPELRKYLMPK